MNKQQSNANINAAQYLLGAMAGEASNYNLADLQNCVQNLNFIVTADSDMTAHELLLGDNKAAAIKSLRAILEDAESLARHLSSVIDELESMEESDEVIRKREFDRQFCPVCTRHCGMDGRFHCGCVANSAQAV